MRVRFILLVVLLSVSLKGNAQVRSIFQNSFFSFDASPNLYISSYGRNVGMGADVAFGNWILNTAGLRFQGSLQLSDKCNSGFKPYYYGHVDIFFDLLTGINGRNKSDSFRSFLSIGVGLAETYSGDRDFCGFASIGAEWKISDNWRFFTELAANIHPSDFDDNLHSSTLAMLRLGLLRDIYDNPTRSRSRFETRCFTNDWFFEVALGASSFNYIGAGSFSDRMDLLTPIFEFGLGKRLTHAWQIRLALSGLYAHSQEELFSYYNARGDLMFDVMAFLKPEAPNFVFTVRPYMSAGVVARLDDQSNFLFSPSFGMQMTYRHDKNNEIFLDSRYVVTPPRFAHVDIQQSVFSVGLFSIAVGYKYVFSTNSFR